MRTPAPTGLGHRTWFVKTGVGAQTVCLAFLGAAGVGRAGAQCAPLHVVYRSIPIDGGRRAEVVAPYGDLRKPPKERYRKARRHLPQRASATTVKFRGQVGAREAERQRMFTAWL